MRGDFAIIVRNKISAIDQACAAQSSQLGLPDRHDGATSCTAGLAPHAIREVEHLVPCG
jgi:hypothetical protein